MTQGEMREAFERYGKDEFLKFERVESPLHARPDLCAFLLLDKLVPRPGRDMVAAAEHDEIFLDTDLDALAAAVTDADILTLVRSGVRVGEYDCLAMFV